LPVIEKQIDKERELMNEAFESFKKTVEFFGEDPNTCTTEEFFGYIVVFIKDFTLSVEAMKSRKNKKKTSGGTNGSSNGRNGGGGVGGVSGAIKVI
jgi:hypothetical protein